MFDRERTILELLAAGTSAQAELAAELIDTHGEDISFTRLQQYANRLGITTIPEPRRSPPASLS